MEVQLNRNTLIWSLHGYNDTNGRELVLTKSSPGPVVLDESKLTDLQKSAIELALKDGRLVDGKAKVVRVIPKKDLAKEFDKCVDASELKDLLGPIALKGNDGLDSIVDLFEHELGKEEPRNRAVQILTSAFNTCMSHVTMDSKKTEARLIVGSLLRAYEEETARKRLEAEAAEHKLQEQRERAAKAKLKG